MALTNPWYKKPYNYQINHPLVLNGVPQAGRASQVPFSGTQSANTFFQNAVGLGGAGGGGGGGNAAGLIGGMPDLSAMRAQLTANSAADAAARDAALRRYVISYGVMPDFSSLGISKDAAGFLSGAINDQVSQLAAKNEAEGTSVHARMQHEADVNQRRVPATLASRGLLHSGQTGVDLAEAAQQAKNTQFDTLNELLGNIENTTSSFLQAERDRAMQLAQMEMEAAWAAASAYGGSDLGYNDGGGGGSQPTVPTTRANTGIPKIPKKPPTYPKARGAGGSTMRTM